MTRPALAALVAAMLPGFLHGQDREKCVFDPGTPDTHLERHQQPSGQYNTYVGRGVLVRCPKRDLTLRADSLESYGDESRLFLLGHVRYVEPRLNLTSDFLTYHQQFERMVATSNVIAKLPNGSTLQGPIVDYYRVMPGVRDVTRLLATQRPTITIVQKDSAGNAADTLTVLANAVNMVGDSLVYASGAVVMTRPEVEAKGDSLFLDSEQGLMILMRDPSITGRKDRPFTLTGIRLELTSINKKLSRVVAKGQGKAVSEDMTLTSDTIDLRISNDLLDRAIAWGPGRAKANSATQQIIADSIDVLMPGQRVRELHAVRAAAAEAQPDTSRFKADTVDWLRGDTIVALFDTAATKDTTRTAQIKELVANGTARSWYHVAPSDTSIPVAAINYVTGRQITVAFKQRRASNVTVVEKATGVHLDPKPPAKPKTDTTASARTQTTTKTPPTKTPPAKPAPAKPAPPKPPQ